MQVLWFISTILSIYWRQKRFLIGCDVRIHNFHRHEAKSELAHTTLDGGLVRIKLPDFPWPKLQYCLNYCYKSLLSGSNSSFHFDVNSIIFLSGQFFVKFFSISTPSSTHQLLFILRFSLTRFEIPRHFPVFPDCLTTILLNWQWILTRFKSHRTLESLFID